MDPRTEANRKQSSTHSTDSGAVATEAATNSPQSHESGRAQDRAGDAARRESVDPMRATDRYRLVHAASSEI